jgi:hypothetical protein
MPPSERKATFVIGAGASHELNLPVGSKLKLSIAELLDLRFRHGAQQSGDVELWEAVKEHCRRGTDPGPTADRCFSAAHAIREAMPQATSIDSFVDAHAGNDEIELVAKLAIVRCILAAERDSKLRVAPTTDPRRLDFDPLVDTWLVRAAQRILDGCRATQIEDRLSSLAFVVFNYDRCVEHFLFYSLQSYFRITADEAARLVQLVDIYHPYGTVGPLPWQPGKPVVAYGEELRPPRLLEIAAGIRTFTQGTDPDSSDIMGLRSAVAESRNLIFLGFAFHRLNLEILAPASITLGGGHNAMVFGTALGFSKTDAMAIQRELELLFQVSADNVKIRNDLTCTTLFDEFSRAISFR